MEKRVFSRILFQAEAVVEYGGETIKGQVENLSLNGMFLKTHEKISQDEAVEIKIFLSGASSDLSINLRGAVVRLDSDGVAIQFKEMDLDSFVHLKNILTYNRGDESEVMEEFYRFLERKKS